MMFRWREDMVDIVVFCELFSFFYLFFVFFFFFSSRRRHTRCSRDWSSDVCSSDLPSRTSSIVTMRRTVTRGCDMDGLPTFFARGRAVVGHPSHRAGPRGAPKIGRASCRERV